MAPVLDNGVRISEHGGMSKRALSLLAGVLLSAGCPRTSGTPPAQPPRAKRPGTTAIAERRERRPDPLEERATYAFDAVPLPDVISALSRTFRTAITVSPTIAVSEWSHHQVSLRMADVSRRAFLDWLARPLRMDYAVEGDGGVWLSRSDDLLEEEPLETRTYRVPTHLTSARPLRGVLVFEREQAAVVETLQACLRYLEERRPGCRIAFHGGQDILVARLPARGHARLEAVLDAMRFGSGLPELPRPSALDLRVQLDTPVEWNAPAGPATHVLFRIAEAAKANLGWDAAAVAGRTLAIPPGKHTLRRMLDAVLKQTPLGRYELEPGHGIWLHTVGREANLPPSSASPWDRATVRAYDIGPVLRHLAPEAILAHVRKQVDPNDWGRGLPAASVFVPTERLIVVHEDAGQYRVAAVVGQLYGRYRDAPVIPKETR